MTEIQMQVIINKAHLFCGTDLGRLVTTPHSDFEVGQALNLLTNVGLISDDRHRKHPNPKSGEAVMVVENKA